MGKEVRFAELVKSAGHPKTVTLWTEPAHDKEFMRAVRENRVLTVLQQTHAKDFGRIGFHEQARSLYLVFPKRLPQKPEARVIGIKYESIEEPAIKDPARDIKPAKTTPARTDRKTIPTHRRTHRAPHHAPEHHRPHPGQSQSQGLGIASPF